MERKIAPSKVEPATKQKTVTDKPKFDPNSPLSVVEANSTYKTATLEHSDERASIRAAVKAFDKWDMPPGATRCVARVGMAAQVFDDDSMRASIIVAMTEGLCVLRDEDGNEYGRQWDEVLLINPRPDLSSACQAVEDDSHRAAALALLPTIDQCLSFEGETCGEDAKMYRRLYDRLCAIYHELHKLSAVNSLQSDFRNVETV